MIRSGEAFSGFSVDDVPKALEFYRDVLGFETSDEGDILHLHLANGGEVIAYPKGDQHTPATFTILNLPVDDIKLAVDELNRRGVQMDYLNDPDLNTDEQGIAWGQQTGQGPNIAWFRDPAGNILSVIE